MERFSTRSSWGYLSRLRSNCWSGVGAGISAEHTRTSASRGVSGSLVRVISAAPIYVEPDTNRQPLRVATAGSVLNLNIPAVR